MNNEEEFLKRLRATFKAEAGEHIQAMVAALLELEQSAGSAQGPAVEGIFRHAHSLKGAARAVNFHEIERLCQRLEDVFAGWRRMGATLGAKGFDTLHKAIDLTRELLDAPDEGRGGRNEPVQAMVLQLGKLAAAEPEPEEGPRPPAQSTPPVEESIPREAAPRLKSAPAPNRPLAAESIRVDTRKLDQLVLNAEETLEVKQIAARHGAEFREIQDFVHGWAKQLIQREPAGAREPEFLEWSSSRVKVLEEKLSALAKSWSQDARAIQRSVDDLLGNSRKLVMLPFSSLSDLIPKVVRDLTRQQGKEADVIVRGGELEIDKRILEEIKDPLIHLLRNCVDHGIEKPEERQRRGKAGRSVITVEVAPVNGGKVEVAVSDDGKGIDLERVKAKAVQAGKISAEEADRMPEARALDLIFEPELSTSQMVTEISGRGLGLSIVRQAAEKLGGRVLAESRRGAGTAFRILLPLTLASFRGVQVLAAGQLFILPTATLERVQRTRAGEIKTAGNRETFSFEGEPLSLAWLEDVLELKGRGREREPGELLPICVIHSSGERLALAADEVLEEEEVLSKSFGKPLVRVRNIAGATILANGRIVPILNVNDLVRTARKGAVPRRAAGGGLLPREQRRKRILVAEDSITSRMLLKGILESAGYEVKTAVDGLDALTRLRSEPFDLLVSDVEMPRMDGFDLTAQVRRDKRLAETPVVLVTALGSDEDRERGMESGASAYIIKSNFEQGNLLEAVRRLA